MFESVETICLFIGNARSGHSLVGSLLDAHPHAVIAHELDPFVQEGHRYSGDLCFPNQNQLFQAIVERSQRQAKLGRPAWRIRDTGEAYQVSHAVPGQHQGTWDKLSVIGSKRGQATSQAVFANPEVLRTLQAQGEASLKLIHVIRNPYDNIASMTPEHKERAIRRYFHLCRGVKKAKDAGWDVLDVYLEKLIEDPSRELRVVCGFLGLEASKEYLRACAELVLKKPNETRFQRSWSWMERRKVRRRMREFDWLEPYRSTSVRRRLLTRSAAR